MRQRDPYQAHRTRWLWILALLILAAGMALHYALSLQPMPPERLILRIWLVALFLSGVCVVSATADRWLR